MARAGRRCCPLWTTLSRGELPAASGSGSGSSLALLHLTGAFMWPCAVVWMSDGRRFPSRSRGCAPSRTTARPAALPGSDGALRRAERRPGRMENNGATHILFNEKKKHQSAYSSDGRSASIGVRAQPRLSLEPAQPGGHQPEEVFHLRRRHAHHHPTHRSAVRARTIELRHGHQRRILSPADARKLSDQRRACGGGRALA